MGTKKGVAEVIVNAQCALVEATAQAFNEINAVNVLGRMEGSSSSVLNKDTERDTFQDEEINFDEKDSEDCEECDEDNLSLVGSTVK